MKPMLILGLNVLILLCLCQRNGAVGREYCLNMDHLLINISYRSLFNIPSGIPRNTTSLDVSHNKIKSVPNNTFYNLKDLRQLQLSSNEIVKFEARSFVGLPNLCYLDITENRLSPKSFPPAIFQSSPNLTELYIQSSFPTEVFKGLTNLRKLVFSACREVLLLGSEFRYLHSMEECYIEHCALYHLTNVTFVPFQNLNLKVFSCYDCQINEMDAGVFVPLTQLQELYIIENQHLGLPNATRSLYGLQHRNMTNITLKNVNSLRGWFKCNNFILGEEEARFLKTICVKSLNLDSNFIVSISDKFISLFHYPLCLKTFSLRDHRMFTYPIGLSDIPRMKSLEYLDVQGSLGVPPLRPKAAHFSPLDSRIQSLTPKGDANISIALPPNLTHLDLSHTIKYAGPTGKWLSNTAKVQFLDLSFNGIYGCNTIVSDTQAIKVLNISDIDCTTLDPNVFISFPELQILEMAGVGLNKGLLDDSGGVLFHQQTQLTYLNMADNGLIHLHVELFKTVHQLNKLSLANNKLLVIPMTLRYLERLQHLDVSYNSLTHLKESERLWIEKTSSETGLSLRLEGNPFACICSTVEFVQWLIETQVNIINREDITCILTNGSLIVLVSLKDDLPDFKIQCVSKFWMTFSVTLGSVVCFVLFASVIGYRFRYNIKYWILTKCRTGYKYETVDKNYLFDAFVAYNHHDYRWVCFTLREFLEETNEYKLCLHHRNFPVGESIQQNIVDAVNSSRKIILVVSKEFISCDWSEFEIQMAGMRMVQEGRENVVVVILLEDIPVRQMPRSLVNMWRQVTFLLWTDDPIDTNLFWERLEEAMARP